MTDAGAGAVGETVVLYTAQRRVVLDTVERDGVYRVKTEYVDMKYGNEAWIFRTAYAFFNQYAPRYLPKPEGAESGIWLHADPCRAGAVPGCFLIKLEIPRRNVLLFDGRVWGSILNLEYVPADEADGRRFEANLERTGVRMSSQAFSTPFYPTVKQEIVKSWQRLFASAEGCPDVYLQGAVWELKPAWIADAREIGPATC